MLGKILRKSWFFAGIAAVILLAFAWPALGQAVRAFHVLEVGIFLAFLIAGLKLETRSILREMGNFRALVAALFSTTVLVPLLALALASWLLGGYSRDYLVGAVICAAAPVTLASGIVMTAIGKGNVALSLVICVASNLLAVFTLPISLSLMLALERRLELPLLEMIRSLLVVVLLPVVVGQLLRLRLQAFLPRWAGFFSVFQQLIVLMIIFNAVASSTGKLAAQGVMVVWALVFMAGLHALVLGLNWTLARVLRLDVPSRTAFTIQASQKTLTVSYLVWSNYLATAFPLAMIMPIAYHLTQMIMDTVLAHRLAAQEGPGGASRRPGP